MEKHLALAACLALATLSAPAFAGDGLVRFEGGRSDLDIRVDGLDGSDEDTAFGVRGGYWFNPNVAIEGFYTRYYSQTYNDGFDDYSIKLHGVGVGVVGKKNFAGDHQGFFISGRAGIARGVATVDYDGELEEAEAGDVKPYFGVGAGYDFSPGFGVGLSYDQVKSGGDGVDVTAKTVTVGIELRF
jgi:hypothetical protein